MWVPPVEVMNVGSCGWRLTRDPPPHPSLQAALTAVVCLHYSTVVGHAVDTRPDPLLTSCHDARSMELEMFLMTTVNEETF